jgi:hypothetical protein
MTNTADVTGGKSFPSGLCPSQVLVLSSVTLYDMHGRKVEVLFLHLLNLDTCSFIAPLIKERANSNLHLSIGQKSSFPTYS